MLAKQLVLIQSHVPLAFSQSALSSALVREKAGAASVNAITKVITARFFITAGAMNSKRGPNYSGSERLSFIVSTCASISCRCES
jgi:hypothetical protein